MNKNLKFFSGLTLGLILGFVLFNVSPSFSKESEMDSDNPSKDGYSITNSQAESLISNYAQNYNLLNNTSYGGVISKTTLKSICGMGADDLIRFRFYHQAGELGQNHIGIIFYKKSDGSSTIVRTGESSFCPLMCD